MTFSSSPTVHPARRGSTTISGLFKVICVGAGLSVLAGCASITSQTPEQIVTDRANSRWKALTKRDFASAYQYNAPGYRANVSPEKYQSMRGGDVQIVSAEVAKATCEPQVRCELRIKVTATAALMMRSGFPKQLVTYTDEVWVYEDGQWWIFEKM